MKTIRSWYVIIIPMTSIQRDNEAGLYIIYAWYRCALHYVLFYSNFVEFIEGTNIRIYKDNPYSTFKTLKTQF